MTQTACGYVGDRDEALIAYLYEDGAAIERATFDAHLSTCPQCREELAELRGVRGHLATWNAPMPVLRFSESRVSNAEPRSPNHPEPRTPNLAPRARESWWREIPAWAQVAAALFVLGVAAGIANLDIRYDANGLSVRTGWMTGRASPASAGRADAAPVPARAAAATTADLAALEQKLRAEFRAVQTSGAAQPALVRGGAGTLDPDTLRRIRAIVEQSVDASERRQQNEIALRVAQVYNDLTAQRRSDLAKIDRNLGFLQSNTRVVSDEALKQREALQRLNYIVSTSQRVPQ
jgi:anti-sigma factor RsiW